MLEPEPTRLMVMLPAGEAMTLVFASLALVHHQSGGDIDLLRVLMTARAGDVVQWYAPGGAVYPYRVVERRRDINRPTSGWAWLTLEPALGEDDQDGGAAPLQLAAPSKEITA